MRKLGQGKEERRKEGRTDRKKDGVQERELDSPMWDGIGQI